MLPMFSIQVYMKTQLALRPRCQPYTGSSWWEQIYVIVHAKRYHKSAKIYIFDYAGFHIYRSVRVFAANLGHIARCVAEIQLFFHPKQRKLRSPKRQFLYVSNFYMYVSVTRCVYFDRCPHGFVAMRDVRQGKKVTPR